MGVQDFRFGLGFTSSGYPAFCRYLLLDIVRARGAIIVTVRAMEAASLGVRSSKILE